MSAAAVRIGLDLGGTALKAVCIDPSGADRGRLTLPTGASTDRSSLLEAVRATVARLAAGAPVAAVGLAVGGMVRADGSMPAAATNLPQLADEPLPPLFTGFLGVPCHVLNDAQAAMHGEAWRGAARGWRNAMVVTLGTGIGAGLMLDGRVRRGPHGSAGEIGAWPLLPGVTFEAAASPAAFERRHNRRLGDAIASREPDAEIGNALDALGRGLASAHLLLDLEGIVITGAITEAGEPLRRAIDDAVRRHCPPAMHHDVRIVLGALGGYAGAIGAIAPTVGSDAG